MTITQTIEVPADRRVFFEFQAPEEIPAGPARVELKVFPVSEKQDEFPPVNARGTSVSDSLFSILSDKPTPRADRFLGIAKKLGDITLEQIKDERLARQLK